MPTESHWFKGRESARLNLSSAAMSNAAPLIPASTLTLRELTDLFRLDEQQIRQGGGKAAIARQHDKGRLTARERIALLVDNPTGQPVPPTGPASFLELGLFSAHGMYAEHGGAPSAGVVTGIGKVRGRDCMIIANDATVKAGAFFPMTCKKIIRAQTIAMMARLPLIYLVDSAGVFLPMQEDVFPDTDDFGRIFRNNAVISAQGIPQIAAIMGYCVAGGGYLPVLCDTVLMTDGSGLYLAGPALVKAAIGQQVSDEDLGGAAMHAGISGTIDFREKDDESCIRRLRGLIKMYGGREPDDGLSVRDVRAAVNVAQGRVEAVENISPEGEAMFDKVGAEMPKRLSHRSARPGADLYTIFADKPGAQYDIKDVIACIVDCTAQTEANGTESFTADFNEYKAEFGRSLVCGYTTVGGKACGIVANQKQLSRSGKGQVQMGGVIYDDSADKAARFIMDCNQRKIPLIFLHDTTGFMVGKESEQGGIIRAGAKMVNAMANCIVPKIVVILGGSYGAGNYAMCGRAFDQFISFAWPNAKCAVMGANQATGVLAMIEEKARERRGESIDIDTKNQILAAIHAGYTEQADIRHAAARGWVDRLIEPHKTRENLIVALRATAGWDYSRPFMTGVLQT